ncbi:arsenate reductase (glutaredoxin) [Mycoplana rhizolycopersici]
MASFLATMTIQILHNPRCSTSRNTLARIRDTGAEPEIIEYLKHPPTREELLGILVSMGAEPRDILRTKEPLAKQLALLDPARTDREIMDAMLDNPSLIERPIVISAKGARLCRPVERVDEIL